MPLLYLVQKQNENWIPLVGMKYIAKYLLKYIIDILLNTLIIGDGYVNLINKDLI